MVQYVCRLVCRGFDQVVDDPDQTFASYAKFDNFESFCWRLAVTFGWNVFTGDISTAFLHALITGEDIFHYSPKWILPGSECCKEIKASTLRLEEFSETMAGPLCFCHEETQLWTEWKVIRTCNVHKTKRLYVLTYVDEPDVLRTSFGHWRSNDRDA